jgi:hypothetical protein
MVLLAACDEAQPTASSEVAAELRALRAVLVQRGTEPTPTAAAPDAAALTAALAPLREVLDGLVKQQRELQQRQLELTQELQRWSQLLVESVGTTRREDGVAMTARLQELETTLKAQEERHRDVEKLLQDALDRTADRLEDFLKRVSPERTAPATPVPGNPTTTETPPETPPKSVGDAGVLRTSRRTAGTVWWSAVAVLGVLCGVVCFRRWRRHAGDTRSPVGDSLDAPAAPSATDPGVQEIWAAAALLGEAVGRLRESHAGGSERAPAANDATTAGSATTDLADDRGTPADAHGAELGEFVVLDDELMRTQQDTLAGREAPTAKPPTTVCHVRTDDPTRAMTAALAFLGSDPRVLRRPEPTVRCGRASLEVAFRALPDLSPGDRTHLEQSLRDACL